MSKVIILDNVLSPYTLDTIEQLCLSTDIAWFRQESATFSKDQLDESTLFPKPADAIESQFLLHTIFNQSQKKVSPFFHHFTPVISAIPYTCDMLLRINMNMAVPDANATDATFGMPHVDFMESNVITAIFYVTDSTGDTIIFNEKFGHAGELTIKERVSPKKGRLVVFDGSLLHSGNTPRDNRPRVVLNINMFGWKSSDIDS